MASSRMILLTTLCSLLIMSTFIDSTHSASCCLWYTSRPLKCSRLLGYTIQTINTSCDINAVIFHVKGRFLCADPSSSHTQKLMRCFDEKRKSKQVQKDKIPITSAST
ncbi:C-C motif chemokine 20b [Notolabrus celidotus]|uniref:C-C motif chemokine 20b n=1 Tax=Notolabrus celidotus TaxID=1203425 RepID=UPI00148F571C|nr:C-C motif chemokine 20b [Notolabrus celidotus]